MALNIDEFITQSKIAVWILQKDGDYKHKNTGQIMSEKELNKYLRLDFQHWVNNNKTDFLKQYK